MIEPLKWASLSLALATACLAGEPATVQEKGAWAKRECLSLADLKDFKPAAAVPVGKYGGWLAKREKATGFFHTAQLEGRWWLVDPEGYVFLCVGMNSVHAATAKGAAPSSDPTNAVPKERRDWAEHALTLLRHYGFNMLGCWSDTDAFRQCAPPLPYCLRWNFMSTYRHQRLAQYPVPGNIEAIYPFDPEFAAFCDQHARDLAPTKNDPWLLGHFADNELPFHEEDIVNRYLSHPANDPNHAAAAKFMAGRGAGKPSKEDDREFLRLVVAEYYRQVGAAIRKYDPNHLFIGSRFHGKALASPSLMTGAGPYADVISVNYYNRWTPENDRLREWSRLAGKPILITEWYAKAADSGLPNDTGAGFLVQAQSDRAKFYQNYTLTLLQNPACVGWHWFTFRDGPRNNPGVVNAKDEPYTVVLDAMLPINRQVYPLAQRFNTK